MKRGKFGLSFTKLLTCKMGSLVPIGWTEVLPGDTVQHATSLLVRASPLVAPVMHPIHVRCHHFFVPYRILWANWENFITGGPDGMDDTAYPTISFVNPALSTLADYLGVPPLAASTLVVSALPFRAYALIYNEFFRDEDLTTALALSTGDGADSTTSVALQTVAWEKDYFTSARPWEQKGAAVTLPLAGTAQIKYYPHTVNTNPNIARFAVDDSVVGGTSQALYSRASVGNLNISGGASGDDAFLDPNGKWYADLTTATAADINTIRQAFALQRFQEARAKYGSRYTEYLRYLGVRSSDARLQRPEYLGGGKQTLQFSEVMQTGVTTSGGDPGGAGGVGQYGGHGIAAARTNRYRRFFEEHGVVMTLLSIRPKTIYASGLKRAFNRRVRTDFWQKEMEHIGQQQVLNQEVAALGSAGGNDSGIFGYQDRYDEYRRNESEVSGEFRGDLNFWNLARQFSSYPTLNNAFVECVPDTRIFADTEDDNMYVMAAHNMQARRMVTPKASGLTF